MSGQEERPVALITGAGRAPGSALALALVEAGMVVAANELSPTLLDPLEAAARSITANRAHAGHLQAYIADATRGMPLRAMIDEVLSDWGRIDVLVNNPRIQPDAALLEMDEWDWQRTIEMNLNGPFLVTQIAARLMREQGGGVILNIVDADLAALEAPGRAAYAASQQGLLALSSAAARELIAYNIRVYTLCPDRAVFSPSESEPEETGSVFAQFAAFLCSPAAVSLPGQVFHICGGSITPEPGLPWQSKTGFGAFPEE